jgi:hypothetical protein
MVPSLSDKGIQVVKITTVLHKPPFLLNYLKGGMNHRFFMFAVCITLVCGRSVRPQEQHYSIVISLLFMWKLISKESLNVVTLDCRVYFA